MSKSITWNVPMGNLTNTGTGYNFYLYGMVSAAADLTLSILDPNGNTWTRTISGEVQGFAFNLPNPLTKSPSDPYTQPYGWTIPSTTNPYSFTVTISSSATGSNEGITMTASNDDAKSVMQVIQYNDPNNSDLDYNDCVLTLAFFPDEPHGPNS